MNITALIKQHIPLLLSLLNIVLLPCVPKEEQLQEGKKSKYNQMSEWKSYHGCEIVECQISFPSWICLELCEQSKEQSDTTSAP